MRWVRSTSRRVHNISGGQHCAFVASVAIFGGVYEFLFLYQQRETLVVMEVRVLPKHWESSARRQSQEVGDGWAMKVSSRSAKHISRALRQTDCKRIQNYFFVFDEA